MPSVAPSVPESVCSQVVVLCTSPRYVLRAATETEAIERALDLVISEHERIRLPVEANERLVTSGIDIKDVYGTFEE